MPGLFSQSDFAGGLDLEFDSTKIPAQSYMFLANGRIRRNSVSPVKKHVKLDIPQGKVQGLYVAGTWLLLFVDGNAYYADLSISNSFNSITGWTELNKAVDRIEAKLIPYTANYFNFQATVDGETEGKQVFNATVGQTPNCVLVTDGVNQPRVIFPNGTWRDTLEYSAWTQNNPEYVPKGVNPVLAGTKLYLLSPDRKQIYQSVSGRPLDFVINRRSNGGAGGDASTTAKAVDYNEITALQPTSDGGLTAWTLFAMYSLVPDTSRLIFGEPYLDVKDIFPVGALNQYGFVDLIGDTGLITQSGIHSFNYIQQTKFESNNFPLGAKIKPLLVNPQLTSVACEFDEYALFAMNTIYGHCVIVYDRIRQVFTGLDFNFGEVKQFAVIKFAGMYRLFFINYENELYEAYASDEKAVCRFYSGEFAAQAGDQVHQVSAVHAAFNNVNGSSNVQLTYLSDRNPVETIVRSISGTVNPTVIPPAPLPFQTGKSTAVVDLTLKAGSFAYKSGVLLEWSGEADLVGLTLDGSLQTQIGAIPLAPSTFRKTRAVFFADVYSPAYAAKTASMQLVSGLTIGNQYAIVGDAHVGDQVVSNTTFRNKLTAINVNGVLWDVSGSYDIVQAMINEAADIYVGGGDLAYPSGSVDDVNRLNVLFAKIKSKCKVVAGNHDLDTASGAPFFSWQPCPRFYSYRQGNIEFFFIDGGYTTAGAVMNHTIGIPVGPCIDPFDNTLGSNQYFWIKKLVENSTATFKVAIVHEPPYTDGSYYPGYVPLRWINGDLFDLVISGHDHNYQRFDVNGTPYVVSGWNASNRYGQNQYNSLIFYYAQQGYLLLEADEYNLKGTAKALDGTIIDVFAVPA